VNQCADKLLVWYDHHHRPLPWRQKVNIYYTWVSEVMSQQTTLAVVVPKFLEFIKHLPTVYDLAACDEQDLRNWHSVGTLLTNESSGKKAAFLGDRGSRSERASGNAEHQTATLVTTRRGTVERLVVRKLNLWLLPINK